LKQRLRNEKKSASVSPFPPSGGRSFFVQDFNLNFHKKLRQELKISNKVPGTFHEYEIVVDGPGKKIFFPFYSVPKEKGKTKIFKTGSSTCGGTYVRGV
jgi:predicted RNA-binding protein with PUA domain